MREAELGARIRAARREKGFSQQELADRLHVVRQTVSKWEGGLSAPDAELLAALAGVLEVPVGRLLGEAEPPEEVEAVSARLAELEGRAARRRETVRRLLHGLCLAVCLGVLAGFLLIGRLGSPYLGWDYADPETAVLGVAFHAGEWLFVRLAPVLLLGGAAGAWATRRRR